MYFLYNYAKYFIFKQIYQQIRSVFPDFLSASYDYGAKNFDEYFHFYNSIAGQKFKMMKQ